ncbi:hypothetical protein D915_007256 [Fasciola hepatica]|uniref:Tetraspanin n=1 Tax=Fasciola hepatica TaxID=6192 RepID=A0A4E0R5V9_FASHE|nr:hypothetical protein D915_007256 [Fasciola hepatica]
MGAMLTYDSYIRSAFQPISDQYGIPLTTATVNEILKYSRPFGTGLVISGILVMFASGFQLLACCCQSRTFVFGYVIFLTILIAMQVIALGVYFGERNLMTREAGNYIKQGIQDYKQNVNATSVAVLQLIMPAYKCCGYNGGSDFQGSPFPATCCKLGSQNCSSSATSQNSYTDHGCKSMFDVYALASIALLLLQALAALLGLINLTFAC